MELPPPQSRPSVDGRRGGQRRSGRCRQRSQIDENLLGGRVALGRRDAQAAADDRVERRDRQLARERGRTPFHHAREHDRGVRSERMLAGRELPGDDAEGEEIGAAVDVAAAQLLGRHVAGCSRRGAGLGQPRDGANVGIGDAREAEIEDLDVTVGAADEVLRLQVAVNDVAGVGGRRGPRRCRRASRPAGRAARGRARARRAACHPARARRRCTARRRSPRARRPSRSLRA